jgi:hypothetical protein
LYLIGGTGRVIVIDDVQNVVTIGAHTFAAVYSTVQSVTDTATSLAGIPIGEGVVDGII